MGLLVARISYLSQEAAKPGAHTSLVPFVGSARPLRWPPSLSAHTPCMLLVSLSWVCAESLVLKRPPASWMTPL